MLNLSREKESGFRTQQRSGRADERGRATRQSLRRPVARAQRLLCRGCPARSRTCRIGLSVGCARARLWAAMRRVGDRGNREASARRRSDGDRPADANGIRRSEEHTSELQSLMRISYAVFCLKKKKQNKTDYDS